MTSLRAVLPTVSDFSGTLAGLARLVVPVPSAVTTRAITKTAPPPQDALTATRGRETVTEGRETNLPRGCTMTADTESTAG